VKSGCIRRFQPKFQNITDQDMAEKTFIKLRIHLDRVVTEQKIIKLKCQEKVDERVVSLNIRPENRLDALDRRLGV
jgi:hypothetical protein